MALSGSVSVQGTPNVNLVFVWTAAQDKTANSSDVTWELQLVSNDVGYIEATPGSAYKVVVDGVEYSGTTDISIATNTTKTLATSVLTLQHDEDGTRSFDFTFSQDFYITVGENYVGVVSGEGTGELDTITADSGEEGGDSGETTDPEEPTEDAATKRKRSYIMGYLLGLVGKPLPITAQKEPVAYLYNGVRLAALPEWDKTVYPYATIQKTVYAGGSTKYAFIAKDVKGFVGEYNGKTAHIYQGPFKRIMCEMNGGDTTWGEITEKNYSEGVTSIGYFDDDTTVEYGQSRTFWANYDMAWDSGEIVLSASDPIPVYE